MAAEYVVSAPLADPEDADFEGMTPVELSIAIDDEKDMDYEGMVRVLPVGADDLQLWAKDSAGNWYDINVTGWGPSNGFPIDLEAETDVYVVVTAEFEKDVTLKLLDVDGDYGAAENIMISQDENVKAVLPYVPEVDAGNSSASWTDNEDGTGTLVITLLDQENEPFIPDPEYGMDDIEKEYDNEWYTLQDMDDGEYWGVTSLDIDDNIYTVELDRLTGNPDEVWNIRVDDVVIESDLEVKITGN